MIVSMHHLDPDERRGYIRHVATLIVPCRKWSEPHRRWVVETNSRRLASLLGDCHPYLGEMERETLVSVFRRSHLASLGLDPGGDPWGDTEPERACEGRGESKQVGRAEGGGK